MVNIYKLKKYIQWLKQAPDQWYSKFDNIISSFGFAENIIDQYIYHKISGRKIIFLILYVDDTLLMTNDMSSLHKVK